MSYNSLVSESSATLKLKLFSLGGDNVNDSSGNNNNGVVVGTLAYANGPYTGSRGFVGDGLTAAVDISASALSFPSTSPFTAHLSAFTDTANCPFLGAVGVNTNRWRKNTATQITVPGAGAFTVPTIGTSSWRHHTVTKSTADNWNVYLDGVVSSTGALNQTSGFAPNRLGLTNATFFDGSLFGLLVFSRELTSTEVGELAVGPEPTLSTNPSISGTLEVGLELTAVSGTIVDPGNGSVISNYSWELYDGENWNEVSTASTYIPIEPGSYRIIQTVVNSGGTDSINGVKTSSEVEVIAPLSINRVLFKYQQINGPCIS